MEALAVVMEKPEQLSLRRLDLIDPGAEDVVVDIDWSGISTGTEKLLWSGTMPVFPGLGYPLVPGYESAGRVIEAGPGSGRQIGEQVFVPGSRGFRDARGLFGGAASRVVVQGSRVQVVPDGLGRKAVLLALAATAHHAIVQDGSPLPDLIVGHGVLGRLMARIAVALGGQPVVWETNAQRLHGAEGYPVRHPDEDKAARYRTICDASGDSALLNRLIQQLLPGGEIVLAGFYQQPVQFDFAPAFMRELRLRVAAEWREADLAAVQRMIADGALDLAGLITHVEPCTNADAAYRTAFGDAGCLKMILEWRGLTMNVQLRERDKASKVEITRNGKSAAEDMTNRLRAEAASSEPEVHTSPATSQTQVIAIYGKGGIGKSFTLANLSYMMAQQGKKVLLIGCDPKSDTTSLLFGGKACPTIIETSSKKKLAGDDVKIGDVCFVRDGVFAMELGGPEVGRGCGGRGIIHGFELLEKLGFHEWGFDYVLLDFLGDVVCGGFGLPIARDMCQKVIIVGSNDLQSLYVANNVCSAVEYFRRLGGNVGVAGIVINKDDGSGEAQAFAAAAEIPVLAAIPADEDIRRKSAKYEIIGRPEGVWGPLFESLAKNVAESEPQRPKPLTPDGLLALFDGDTVGRDVVLIPATIEQMCGRADLTKPTLEVVYDDV